MCGACKRDATEAARAAEREALRHGGPVAPAPEVVAPAAVEPATEPSAEPPAEAS